MHDNINNASIVISYTFGDVSIIFPGDIEPDGWANLRLRNTNLLETARRSRTRILLAPHHGRWSGYSQDLVDYISPHLVVISDGYGAGETDARFRNAGLGLKVNGVAVKYVTTKNKGRKRITISDRGEVHVHEADM